MICIVTRGTLTVRSRAYQEIVCQEGEVYLGPNDLPAERIFSRPTSFVDIAVPRVVVGPALADRDRTVRQQKLGSIDASELRLLAGYVQMLARSEKPIPPEVASLAVTHVHDLVVMALGANRGAAEQALRRGVRAARMRGIKADSMAHLTRGDLTLDQLAARQSISPQYVRALLNAEGTTFTGFCATND